MVTPPVAILPEATFRFVEEEAYEETNRYKKSHYNLYQLLELEATNLIWGTYAQRHLLHGATLCRHSFSMGL